MQMDSIQKIGKDGVDATYKALGAWQQGVQTAAVEAADYAKRTYEHGAATLEKLAGVRTLDKAFEIQGDYLRGAYEGFVGQMTKMSELATKTAREVAAPVQGLVAQVRTSA
ncbi:MAG: phasin family protein [Methylobacteriaceae bacterium]|nr:phasin family protein [Methylobacteriaceae bacterium]